MSLKLAAAANQPQQTQQQQQQQQQQQSMKITINLNEKDIIKLIIEFLANRELNISMLDLERETGIINGAFSDDILFLRQLILDGQWDDALEFIQPLKQIDSFNTKQFYFVILKYQYLELLCLKSEAGASCENQLSVEQLVSYLNDLRQYTPSEDEYKKLCLLLTSTRLQDHSEYRAWNPSSGRLACFKQILPLVSKFLSSEQSTQAQLLANRFTAQNERLVQLLVKGLLYESCVEYCQARATNTQETYNLNDPNVLLIQQHLSETDASLLSWLHALPIDTFSCPFEEKALKLNLDKFSKPSLEAQWADAILATPIKPQQLFPYNAVPSGRSRNTELMSRSLAPQYEGLAFGLTKSQLFTSGVEMKLNNLNANSGANNLLAHMNQTGTNGSGSGSKRLPINDLTRSIALFNFESTPFEQSTIGPLSQAPAPIEVPPPPAPAMTTNGAGEDQSESSDAFQPLVGQMSDSLLFKEYRKNKAQIIQQLEEQEKKRDEFIKQLKSPNIYNALNAVSSSKSSKLKSSFIDGSSNNTIIEEDETVVAALDENGFSNSSNALYASPRALAAKSQQQQRVNNGHESSSISPINEINTKSPVSTSLNQSPNITAKQTIPTIHSQQPNQPPYNQHDSSHNVKKHPSSNQRPINETIKFDSLEDITKAASFHSICMIEDQQAIRAVDIHPSGEYYVVGSNSKCLRVCPYPNLNNIKSDYVCKPASVLYKKSKHHYGSIYCVSWNPSGNLIATGSNDKTIKLVKFSPDLTEDTESEIELTYHNGTVRDLIFMQQEDNNILVSGGAGDCKIHVLDCQTQQPLRVYTGHSGHVYTLYTWTGTKNVFVSGSQDKTCRFWDLRCPEAIQVVSPTTTLALQGSPVAAVAVDPNGLLLSSGHEDAACCLYDIRGSRIVQIYKPHTSDIRSVRFSTNAYYLLTASYDNKVIITDLHGDLTKPLNWSVVAQHNDKIIQAKWHPTQMSFITTSADRTSVVWSLPTNALANTSVI